LRVGVRRGPVGQLLNLEPGRFVKGVEDRNPHDLDRELARRIVDELDLLPEIDDARDPRLEESRPAVIGQQPDAVRADHGSESGRAAILSRQPAEVADVDAPVPDEVASGHYAAARTTCAPRSVVELAAS